MRALSFKEKNGLSGKCVVGEYEPRSGATGSLTFGLPIGTVPDDRGTQTFHRLWKKTAGLHDRLSGIGRKSGPKIDPKPVDLDEF